MERERKKSPEYRIGRLVDIFLFHQDNMSIQSIPPSFKEKLGFAGVYSFIYFLSRTLIVGTH